MIITRHSTHQLAVSFPYHKPSVATVKAIPGSTYDKPTKTWFVPLPALRRLLAAFPRAQIDATLPDEVAQQCAAWFYESLRALGVTLAFDPAGHLAAANLPAQHVLQGEIRKRSEALFALLLADERKPLEPVTVRPSGEATAVEVGIINAGKRALEDERRRERAGRRRRKKRDDGFTQATLLDLLR